MKRLFLALLFISGLAWGDSMPPISVPSAATVTISCTSSSAATALYPQGIGQIRQVEITNNGTVNVFVEFGVSTVTAVVASAYPYLPNQTKVQTIPTTATHVACIAASGTQTVYATVGIGE